MLRKELVFWQTRLKCTHIIAAADAEITWEFVGWKDLTKGEGHFTNFLWILR